MIEHSIVENTKQYVQQTLANAEGGHDWFHIQRVYNNALSIAQEEPVDLFVVQLAALLHDIADAKFHNGDETIGPKMTEKFLTQQGVAPNIVTHVKNIVQHLSFKNSLDQKSSKKFFSAEFAVVQDADRLDALGAIGIARTFNYGGYKNRPLYDPNIPPINKLSKAQYKASTAPTINHFYEKLLLLKDQMHTKLGKKMAQQRHAYLEQFLEQFFQEWQGKR